jgi:hypothetical protein
MTIHPMTSFYDHSSNGYSSYDHTSYDFSANDYSFYDHLSYDF